jgi:uncharacterized delta-60 repeat protein
VVRFNADGSLDTTFDGDGMVTGTFLTAGHDVALQPDGKLVVGGRVDDVFPGASHRGNFAVARFNPDGSLDPTFDGDGVAVTVSPTGGHAVGYGLALDAAGRIVSWATCTW